MPITLSKGTRKVVDVPGAVGGRVVLFKEYSSAQLQTLGELWAREGVEGAHRYYAHIPTDTLMLDGFEVQGEERIGSVGIDEAFIRKLERPCQIKAPMNLQGNHWTGFAISINENKEVTIQYMDSMNGTLNWAKHPTASREADRIQEAFRRAGYTVVRKIVYPETWQQADLVSCGAFFMENADRALGYDKWEGHIPTAAEIREQQLQRFQTASALVQISDNDLLYQTLLQYIDDHAQEAITEEVLRRMFEANPEFKRAVIFEYMLAPETFEASSQSAQGGVERALKGLNEFCAVLEQQKVGAKSEGNGVVLTVKEQDVSRRIAGKISYDLFQSGAIDGRRKEDSERIAAHVASVLFELREVVDIEQFTPEVIAKLVGHHCSDFQHKWAKGKKGDNLAQKYYDHSKYTTMGKLLTGGVYMPESHLGDVLREEVKKLIIDKIKDKGQERT